MTVNNLTITNSKLSVITILGVRISDLSLDRLLDRIEDGMTNGKREIICYINIHALNISVQYEWYRNFLNQCKTVYCDGFGVWFGALITRQRLFTRNTPPDFIDNICERAIQKRMRVFLLGARPGVADLAAKRLLSKFPELQIMVHHGYFNKSDTADENIEILRIVNDYHPNIVFVGFGVPLQEDWIRKNINSLNCNLIMPAGALFDYVAGTIPRAPRWVTDYGFEWVARLIAEPKRLWRRYIFGNPLFYLRVFWYDVLGFPLPHFNKVIDIQISPTSYKSAVKNILLWAEKCESRYICVANVHMTMEAHDSHTFANVVNRADLVTPDGMPLVWMMRRLGIADQQRVYGPDLTIYTAEAAAEKGISIGVYGSTQATLDAFCLALKKRFPKLKINYSYSPPFRELTAEEDQKVIKEINESGVRILLVGLGCPKQERWMAAHRGKISAVMLGVGAAFDIHGGLVSQAPPWMQRIGLEWLFRLIQEPRRLWKRYFYHNPRFVYLAIKQLFARGV